MRKNFSNKSKGHIVINYYYRFRKGHNKKNKIYIYFAIAENPHAGAPKLLRPMHIPYIPMFTTF